MIIGGGISQTGELFLDSIRKVVHQFVLSKHYLQDFQITQVALSDDAGLYGALALARDSISLLPNS